MAFVIKQLSSKLDKEINFFEPGQRLVGIDIGSNLVKMVVLKETPIGTRLVSISLAEIFREEKEGSEVNLQKRIQEAIKKAQGQLKQNIKKICIIISTPSLSIKNITLPAMPEEELKESVKWEMEQNIGFPINEATLDFLVGGESIRAGTKNLELEVVTAKSDEIKSYLQTFTQNRLNVQSINIPAFCLWNVFQKSNQWKEEDTIALVDIGARITRINIFNNNILRFTREIFFGGETITQTLVKEMNLSPQEAEDAKIKFGLNDNSIYYDKICQAVKQLGSEIDRSFGYYKAQFHIERIDRLVLYGGASKLINLDKFLSEDLGLFVEIGNPLNGLLFDQKAFANLEEFNSFFALAIGVALNSGAVKRINLLPLELRKDTKLQTKKLLFKVVPLLVFCLLAWVYLNIVSKEKKLSKEKIVQEEIITIWKNQQDLEKKHKFLNSIYSVQESWLKIFKGISQTIPEGVWLNSIQLEPTAKKLVLEGAGQSNILVIDFVRKLESLAFFGQIKLDNVEEKSEKEKLYIFFKIIIFIK